MSFLLAARAAFVLLVIVVTYLIVAPNPEGAETGLDMTRWIALKLFGDPELGDKVGHFLAFCSLGASASLARIRIAGSGAATIAALALYGGALEIVQLLGGVRDAQFFDAVADGLGALAGYPAMAWFVAALRLKARA